jgi:hypothetical protein
MANGGWITFEEGRALFSAMDDQYAFICCGSLRPSILLLTLFDADMLISREDDKGPYRRRAVSVVRRTLRSNFGRIWPAF